MTPEAVPTPQAAGDLSLKTALDCYLSAIQDIAETVKIISPEIGASHYDQLIRLRTRLAFEANAQTLQEIRDAVHHELEGYAAGARRYSQAFAEDVNQTLALISRNEDTLSERNNRYAGRLAQLAEQMDAAARSGDVQRLAEQAGELRDFARSMEQDGKQAFSRLQERMAEFQNKLREAELQASIDPLTGVANRREFDRQLASRIASGRGFCVLLFDLDLFKAVNDQYGHLFGDEVLRQLGSRLNGQVRARDFVCRWGGDEFVVLLEAPLSNAVARAQQISQWLNGPYRVFADRRDVKIDINVSVGVAEYIQGETPEDLFQRVDASLYLQKGS